MLPISGPVTDINLFKAQLQSQITNGLYANDVAFLGGTIALPQGLGNTNGTLDLPVAPSPQTTNSTYLADLVASLNAMKGQKRVFPIGQITTSGMGVPVASRISDFVVGRIVYCIIDDNGTVDQTDDSLLIVVQPSLLQTSTALVRATSPANPWLGKLMLIR